MSTDHVVQQGEHLSQIAKQYGFRDFNTVWNHPDNAALKKLRQSPNVLFPGDTVKIPDKTQKKESRPTGKKHSFKLTGGRLLLRLALRDFDNQPLANTACQVQVEGASTELTTDANGRVEVPISATLRRRPPWSSRTRWFPSTCRCPSRSATSIRWRKSRDKKRG